MATQVHYLNSALISANLLQELSVGVPQAVVAGQGWKPGTNAAPNYAPYTPGTSAPTFVTTEPTAFSAKGVRSGYTLNGTYANANWVLDGIVRSGTVAFDGTGVVKFRLWQSVNADGSSATQITNGWQASSTITFADVNNDQAFQITWSPGATVTLTNEYLFLEIEWSIVGTGSANMYVYFKINGGTGEKLTTPDFTPASAGGGLTLPKRYGMAGVA